MINFQWYEDRLRLVWICVQRFQFGFHRFQFRLDWFGSTLIVVCMALHGYRIALESGPDYETGQFHCEKLKQKTNKAKKERTTNKKWPLERWRTANRKRVWESMSITGLPTKMTNKKTKAPQTAKTVRQKHPKKAFWRSQTWKPGSRRGKQEADISWQIWLFSMVFFLFFPRFF